MRRPPVPLAALLVLAGCCMCTVAGGAGDARVDQSRATALVKQLADQTDSPTSIECPAGVVATVGASFDCTVTFPGGVRHTVVVTIKAVDKATADVDATAAWRTPVFGAKQRAILEQSMADKLGVKVELHCKDSVIALGADQRVRCAVRGAEGEVPVDIWDSGGGNLGWKINPDAPDAPAGGAPAPSPPAEAPAATP
jgi:hypothetical protein